MGENSQLLGLLAISTQLAGIEGRPDKGNCVQAGAPRQLAPLACTAGGTQTNERRGGRPHVQEPSRPKEVKQLTSTQALLQAIVKRSTEFKKKLAEA